MNGYPLVALSTAPSSPRQELNTYGFYAGLQAGNVAAGKITQDILAAETFIAFIDCYLNLDLPVPEDMFVAKTS